jgi:hypothetical protein
MMTFDDFMENKVFQGSIVELCNLDMKEFRESGKIKREDTLSLALDWYIGIYCELEMTSNPLDNIRPLPGTTPLEETDD